MMNEFPPKYREVVRESSGSETPMLNGTECLERVFAGGVRKHDLPVIPPLFQHRIWCRMAPGDGPERPAGVIEELSQEDDRSHIEGGSWTNDVSWLRGCAARARCRRSRPGHSSDPHLARSRGTARARQVPPQAQPAVDVLWPAGLGDQQQHGDGGRRCPDQSGVVDPAYEPKRAATSSGQRRGCTAATSTSTSPLSTSSRRPTSSPDVPDRPTDIERRTAHALKAREANDKAREAKLARTQRNGEARPRHDRPARP
jgi:hypothetical protein